MITSGCGRVNEVTGKRTRERVEGDGDGDEDGDELVTGVLS
jgi:hypothetical protein